MNTLFLCQFFHPQGKETPTTHSVDAPSFQSTPGSTLSSNAIQHEPQGYYDLAQRLRHLSPPACSWLEPGDVRIIDTTAFSSGGFSDVRQGSLQGIPVAVKCLRCYSSPEFDPAEVGLRFLKEVWASAQLSHPNVVPFLGVYSTPSQPFALLYGMMDNLDLGRYRSSVNLSFFQLAEISRALKHMHNLDIIHRNLNMRNVLVDNSGVAHLGGLGSAFVLSLPASWSGIGAGTLFAPELSDPHAFGLDHMRTTKATDMFSFGMLAWEVFAGKPPFAGKIEAAVIFSVFNHDRPWRPAHPEVSDRVWTMIQECWDSDPFQRMTAAGVVDLLEAEM